MDVKNYEEFESMLKQQKKPILWLIEYEIFCKLKDSKFKRDMSVFPPYPCHHAATHICVYLKLKSGKLAQGSNSKDRKNCTKENIYLSSMPKNKGVI